MRTPQADLEKQFDLRMKIYNRLLESYRAVNQLRGLRAQLTDIRGYLQDDPAQKAVLTSAEDFDKKIDALESALINPKLRGTQDSLSLGNGLDGKFALLATGVESADAAPAQELNELFLDLDQRVSAPLKQAHELMSKDVPTFNELARKAGIGPLLVPRSGSGAARR